MDISTDEEPKSLAKSSRHRHNHRAGVRERARQERKASAALSLNTTPQSTLVSGQKKKHNHRAGVKHRAKREREALYKTTNDDTEALQDSDGNFYNGGFQDYHDTPSLTYDSDKQSDNQEDAASKHELVCGTFSFGVIGDCTNPKAYLYTEESSKETDESDIKHAAYVNKTICQDETTQSTSSKEGSSSQPEILPIGLTPIQRQREVEILSLLKPIRL